MSEPAGLGLSLDDLIKRSSTSQRKQEGGGKRAGMAGGRGVGGSPNGVRGGGIAKRVVPSNSAAARNGHMNGGGPGSASGGRSGRGGGASGGPSNRPAHNDSAATRPGRLDTSYDAAGTLNVRLKETDIVSVAPNGQVTLTSGSWRTPTTLNCINRVLNLIGASIGCQGAPQDSDWQVSVGTALTRFEDGMKIPSKGRATADRAQIIYDGLQHGMEPPQGRSFSSAGPSFSNGGNNHQNGGFQGGQNRNGNWAGGADSNNFNNGNRRNNGQQSGNHNQNNGMQFANNGSGYGSGGSNSNGSSMNMNDPATAAVMMAGYQLGLQRSMAAGGGAGGMGNSMMGFGGMGGMGMMNGGMGMGMGGMGMGMSSLSNMGQMGGMYGSGMAHAKQLAATAAAPAVSRQQYDAARAAASAAAAAAAGGADMMDEGNGYGISAPVQRQSGVRGGNVFNRLTAGVAGSGPMTAESEEARRLRAQGRFASY